MSRGATTWRLQKLDDIGAVLGTDQFSLPADINNFEMVGLAVDSRVGRVYALVEAFVTQPSGSAFEYVEEVLAWSATPDSGQLRTPAGLATDWLSTGINGYPAPGVLSPFSALVKKNGMPAIILPEGLTVDVDGTTHYLAIQSADDTANGTNSGIAQVATDTGTNHRPWSAATLEFLPQRRR